jgi:hypothetical protein
MVFCRSHPRADKQGYVFLHILVVEEGLGRYLLPKERVVFVDGNKNNLSPDNLKVLPDKSSLMKFIRANRFWSGKKKGNE